MKTFISNSSKTTLVMAGFPDQIVVAESHNAINDRSLGNLADCRVQNNGRRLADLSNAELGKCVPAGITLLKRTASLGPAPSRQWDDFCARVGATGMATEPGTAFNFPG
jgi:hypothetical protein